MRSLVLGPMLLCALAGCNRGAASAAPDGAPVGSAAVSASASSVPAASGSARPREAQGTLAEHVPNEYGRYFIDGERFSAIFPKTPEVRRVVGTWTAVESVTELGDFEVLCSPLKGDGQEFARAHDKAVGDGELLGEEHPTFFGTEAYDVRVQRKDKGLRIMRFVKYQERFCSVGAEMNDNKHGADGDHFVESFRPERKAP